MAKRKPAAKPQAENPNPYDGVATIRLSNEVVKARQLDDPFEAAVHGVTIGRKDKTHRVLFVQAKRILELATRFEDDPASQETIRLAVRLGCHGLAIFPDEIADSTRAEYAVQKGKWMYGPLERGSCQHDGLQVYRWFWDAGTPDDPGSPEDSSEVDLLWSPECCNPDDGADS